MTELQRQALIVRNTTHGLSLDETGRKTRLYSNWARMKQRCRDVKAYDFARYGGRGISVCVEWLDYKTFHDWALLNGYREGMTIERIDNDGNYEPRNCTWIPASQQARNKRNNHFVTHWGVRKTLAEWSQILGIESSLLRYRLAHWSIDRALSEPIRGRIPCSYNACG